MLATPPTGDTEDCLPDASANLVFRPGVGHYDGGVKGSLRHGHGVQTWECGAQMGSRYAGEWRDDRAHGKGTLTVRPGRLVANGTWRAGRLHGWSSSVHLDEGQTFHGVFRDGLPHGPDCVWTRPSSKQRFTGKYLRGCVVHGVLEDNSALEPHVSEWHCGEDKSWDWVGAVGLEMLMPTAKEVEETLSETEWMKRRTDELGALWQADQAAVLELVQRYQWEPEEEGSPFTSMCLGALAGKMWQRTPSAHMFAQTRTLGKLKAQERGAARTASKDSMERFMEQVNQANEHCTFAGSMSSHVHKISDTVESLKQAQHPRFFREVLVGRAAEVHADSCGLAVAGLHLDLTSAPCKPGDMEYLARLPYGNSSKIASARPGNAFPRKYVDRLCGHTLRQVQPRVDVSVQNLLGHPDEDVPEVLIRYRMHGASSTTGCQQSVSGGSSHDLSGTCSHLASYSDSKDFAGFHMASECLRQVRYEMGPKLLDAEGKQSQETERSLRLRTPAVGAGGAPGGTSHASLSSRLANGKEHDSTTRDTMGEHMGDLYEGMSLPGIQRKHDMVPEVMSIKILV